MEKHFVLKNNLDQKKNGFGVTLNSYLKPTTKKLEIETILQLLNFYPRKSDALGAYEATTVDLNDRETFEAAFNFLQVFNIDHRYRLKNSLLDFWVCNRTIWRKKISESDLNTQKCRVCLKKNSKYRDTCWNCGTPF